jgi:hypothetical protein
VIISFAIAIMAGLAFTAIALLATRLLLAASYIGKRSWPTGFDGAAGPLGESRFRALTHRAVGKGRVAEAVVTPPKVTSAASRRKPRLEQDVSSAEQPTTSAKQRRGGRWGVAPYFALLAGAAGVLVAVADALNRSGRGGGVALFWLVVLGLMACAAFRLSLLMPPRLERIGIVLIMGEFLYLVKVLKDPFAFMYSDELVHAFNAQRVLETGSVLHANPILPVTGHYVGLPAITDAVSSLTGLKVFGAGLLVVGVARLVIMLGLFLLFEDVAQSARVAGLAALFYTAHPNFVFFTGQYAYESLAFPLAVVAIAAVNRWMLPDDPRTRRGWAIAALIAITGVVMTHHMTTYALVGFLLAASVAHHLLARQSRYWNPWPFAGFTVVAAVIWLVFIASDTAGYLSVIFGKAFQETIRTVAFESAPRQLFKADAGGGSPWGERVVGLASVALIAGVMPIALLDVWRRHRRNTVAVVLAIGASAYVGVLFLRFVPRAWEIANRSSEFLFVGVALMLAFASVRAVSLLPRGLGRTAVAGAAALLLAGGIIAGWPTDLRLSLPYRVDAAGRVLEPQGTTAARWSRSNLGTGRNFVADPSNARLQLWQGEIAYAGGNPNLNDILRQPLLASWMVDQLREKQVRYLVMDRRRISQNQTFGNYFFSPRAARLGLYSAAAYAKFDRQPGMSKVYDSGNVSIYDLREFDYDAGIR